jgi:signal transduction histidine kinase/ActR/RegA family two-component response regulator/HPt (histidine-containing phosphotransfer) domain-containing protein
MVAAGPVQGRNLRLIASALLLWTASGGGAAWAGPAGPEAPGWGEGLPPLRVFTARDTGLKTMAWSAAQDRRGTMYFGCDTVISFDGDRWHSEDTDQSYAIRGLDIGPNGRIWVGGVNQIGWFESIGQGRLEYHSLMSRLPDLGGDLGEVWKVFAEGNEGAVFVAREKILRWDGRRFTSWDYPGAGILWATRTETSVYFHYPPVGLMRLGPAGPSVAVPASVVGSSAIRWLDDSRPDWLLLTSDGLRTLRQGTCVPLEGDASTFVRLNTPTSAARIEGDLLAIGTLKGGIAIVDRQGRVRRLLNVRAGLPANQIYCLFADRDGALWALGPSSIARLAIRSGVSVYGQSSGYPAGGCESVAEHAGQIYAVSHSDILRLARDAETGSGGQFVPLGITSNRFYSLLSLPQGVFVGHFHGLGILSGQELHPLTPSEASVYRIVSSEARPGAIVASHDGTVDRVDPLSGRSTLVADSFPDYGDSLAEEPSGRLWIGTQSKGLYVAFPGAPRSIPAAPRFGSLPKSGPTLVTRAGSTVVALTRDAAYFLDPDAGQFRRVEGSPAGNPSALSNADSHGAAWAAYEPEAGGHSPRLGKISWVEGRPVWIPQSLEGLASIGSPLFLYSVPSGAGDELWIAGSEALIHVSPEAQRQNPPPPRPLIHAWVMGEGDGAIRGVLPYSTHGIHVEYSSLDYGKRESERFQTMLVGAEGEWSAPTNSADRDISGLREGSYDFMVRLKADSGQVGAPAILHFDIAPPWWRTPLAYGIYGLAGTLSVLAIVRIRQRSLRRRAMILEELIRQRTDDLEKANAAKTKFVASMSHEIRNPMGGILGTSLALSHTPLGPEQRDLVSTLRNCAVFLASLVEDVLDFAAIEAGALKISHAPLVPREVLATVVKMLAPGAGEARLEIEVDPEMPGSIVGDAARIQQVIVNFTVNSLKFGGKNIRLSVGRKDGCAVFAVADDGSGIAAEEQKKLFVQFSRLESVRNASIPGSGLGLALSRALAERMGGSVGVESAPGRGSTFYLNLPLVTGVSADPRPREFRVHGARALVVEDIDYNAGALGWMLEGLGFQVEFAADGDEALRRLASAYYEVIFLDCDLPKVSGLEVARRFRNSETEGRRSFIVATTALSTLGDQDACLASGMDAFLAKPITPEKLSAVLAGTRALAPETEPGAPEIDLGMIRRMAEGVPGRLEGELAKFSASLGQTVLGVAQARASGSRTALASAAHRVLSHARMVGAARLAGTASDLQEFAGAYSESELEEQIGLLARQAAELGDAVGRAGQTSAPPP